MTENQAIDLSLNQQRTIVEESGKVQSISEEELKQRQTGQTQAFRKREAHEERQGLIEAVAGKTRKTREELQGMRNVDLRSL